MLKRASAMLMCIAMLFFYIIPVSASDELILVGGDGADGSEEYEFDYWDGELPEVDESFYDNDFWYSDEFGNPIDVTTIGIQSLDIAPYSLVGDFLKNTAETMLSVLNAVGVYIKNGVDNEIEFAKNVYNALSGKSKAIIDEKSEPRGSSGGSFGRYTKVDDEGNEQDVFDISVDEYKTLKEDIKNIYENYQKSEDGREYFPFIFDYHGLDKYVSSPTSLLNTDYKGTSTNGKQFFRPKRDVLYTFWVYIASDSTLFNDTSIPRIDGYRFVDFQFKTRENKDDIFMYKLHESNVWLSQNVSATTCDGSYYIIYYADIAKFCFYYLYYAPSATSYHSITSFSSPVMADRIYINANFSGADFSNVMIDNRVFNNSVIENNWQTLVKNDYNNTYQTFNVYNSDTYDYSDSSVESVINNYNIINNYNYYEQPPSEPTDPKPPTEPSEPIEDSTWFNLLIHSIGTWFDLLIDEVQNVPSHFPTKDDIYNYFIELKYSVDDTKNNIVITLMDFVNSKDEILSYILGFKDEMIVSVTEFKEDVISRSDITDDIITGFLLTLSDEMKERTGEIVDSINELGLLVVESIELKEISVDLGDFVDGIKVDVSGFENSIKTVFVPNQENIDGYFNEVKEKIDSKFGFVKTVQEADEEFISMLQSVPFEESPPTFEVEIYGRKMSIIDFSIFDDYIGVIRSLTVALMWAFFIFRTVKRLPKIIGGI